MWGGGRKTPQGASRSVEIFKNDMEFDRFIDKQDADSKKSNITIRVLLSKRKIDLKVIAYAHNSSQDVFEIEMTKSNTIAELDKNILTKKLCLSILAGI